MSEFLSTLENIHPILVCLLVCATKIIEITIQSLKTCMMVKGRDDKTPDHTFNKAKTCRLEPLTFNHHAGFKRLDS